MKFSPKWHFLFCVLWVSRAFTRFNGTQPLCYYANFMYSQWRKCRQIDVSVHIKWSLHTQSGTGFTVKMSLWPYYGTTWNSSQYRQAGNDKNRYRRYFSFVESSCSRYIDWIQRVHREQTVAKRVTWQHKVTSGRRHIKYRIISNVSHTKYQNLYDSRLGFQSLPNPLKPGVKSRRCIWSSADRRCSNYIWVIIDKFIA